MSKVIIVMFSFIFICFSPEITSYQVAKYPVITAPDFYPIVIEQVLPNKPQKKYVNTYNQKNTQRDTYRRQELNFIKYKNGKPILHSSQDSTKITIVNNQIFIPVTLINNGLSIKIQLVLDTGCSHTSIPYKYLNKIRPKFTERGMMIVADGRKVPIKRTVIDYIKVGSKKERSFPISGSEVVGSQNTGLLGLDFLKNHPFRIDFEKQILYWL